MGIRFSARDAVAKMCLTESCADHHDRWSGCIIVLCLNRPTHKRPHAKATEVFARNVFAFEHISTAIGNYIQLPCRVISQKRWRKRGSFLRNISKAG